MTSVQPSAGLWPRIERFWFRPVSAAGFGMMRVAYAALAFAVMALQWNDVVRFYSDEGMMPHALALQMLRPEYRFTLLLWTPETWQVSLLYLVLLGSLLCVLLGVRTRIALIVSTVLLYSFHEYNPILLDGGDTLLRLIAFILVLSPCDRTFTLANLKARFARAVHHGDDQPAAERTMPIWPYRLLLWQMVWLYASSVWEKLSGHTWLDGTAVAIVLHHPHFSRLPAYARDLLTPLSPVATYGVLFVQSAWVLLLLLPVFDRILPEGTSSTVKRAVLLGGVLMHAGIALFMDVGLFSWVVFTAYLGLLLDDDFRAIRAFCNRKGKTVTVLFDGTCGLCRRSVVALKSMDWLHRLHFADFNDPHERHEHAAGIDVKELERAIHVKTGPKTYEKGFRGFRVLCKHLPALWPLWPLLYLPGAVTVGDWVYDNVASRRMRCSDGVCRI